MGEWSRARDAIHDATTREARDAAIDEYWRLAQRAYQDHVLGVPDAVHEAITEPGSLERVVLDWVRAELTKLVAEDRTE